MASTFTDLGIELMATGENAGTWGTKTNANLSLIEQLTGGVNSQAVTDSGTPTALTIADGALTGTAQHRVIELTGTISGNRIVTFPLLTENFYIIKNGTSGAHTVQLKAASGSGATVTFTAVNKATMIIYLDGVATNTGVFDTGLGDVTLTGTQTLTNKSIVATQLTGTIPTARLSGAYTGITSLGTITSFRSTGIDDNSNALAMTIDSSESVGINNTNMASFDADARNLVVGSGSGDNGLTVFSDGSSSGSIFFGNGTSGTQTKQGQIVYEQNNNAMIFSTAATERMRIPNGGLLVGKSSANIATAGFEIASGGDFSATKSGSTIAQFNRLTNDGDVVRVKKDGTTKHVFTTTALGVNTSSPSATLDVNGDIKATNFVGSGGLQSTQLFTSSGTYTRPSGITKIRVFVTAGGGGGGGNDVNSPSFIAASGGGAGGTAIELIDASGTFANQTVTIGAGGAGGDGSAGGTTANGQNGGTSSFGSFCSASGGTGGPKATNIGISTYVQGGVGADADLDLRGNSGGGGNLSGGANKLGGRGGGSYWGGGGSGTIGNTGSAGLHGSGGGGTFSTPGGSIRDGGAGGSGIVYVEEYA